jgi:hypothetical protein
VFIVSYQGASHHDLYFYIFKPSDNGSGSGLFSFLNEDVRRGGGRSLAVPSSTSIPTIIVISTHKRICSVPQHVFLQQPNLSPTQRVGFSVSGITPRDYRLDRVHRRCGCLCPNLQRTSCGDQLSDSGSRGNFSPPIHPHAQPSKNTPSHHQRSQSSLQLNLRWIMTPNLHHRLPCPPMHNRTNAPHVPD